MRLLICLFLLGACSSAPDLGSDRSAALANAPFPKLVPLQTLIDGPEPEITPDLQAGLAARLASLKLRAARLRAVGN